MKVFSLCLFSLVSLASTPLTRAQDVPAAPTAEQIFETCAKACGGKEKIAAIQTVVMAGDASIAEFGLTGEVKASYRKGDLQVEADFNNAKTIQGVTDGQGWELSPTAGPRLMSDAETEQLMEAITLRTYADPKSVYSSMKNTGLTKLDGVDCYRVKLVRKIGDAAEEILFNVKTGLPVQSTGVRKTELGEVNIVTTMSEYKTFDGLTIPTKTVSRLESIGMTYTANTKSITYNQPVPESAFAVPAGIRTLLDKEKAK